MTLKVHTVKIQRKNVSDTKGVVKSGYADVSGLTAVKCFIQEIGGKVVDHSSGRELEYSAIAMFDPDVTIKPRGVDDEKDRIEVTATEIANAGPAIGTQFLVVHAADESGMGHHLTAFLRRHRKND